MVLSGVCDLGMPTAMFRLPPEYLERGEYGVLRGAAARRPRRRGPLRRLGGNHRAADQTSLEALVRDAMHWTFWPTLVAAVGTLPLDKPLLWLLSPKLPRRIC